MSSQLFVSDDIILTQWSQWWYSGLMDLCKVVFAWELPTVWVMMDTFQWKRWRDFAELLDWSTFRRVPCREQVQTGEPGRLCEVWGSAPRQLNKGVVAESSFKTYSGVLGLQHSTTELLILQPLNSVHSQDWLIASCLLVKLIGERGWSVDGTRLHSEIQLRNGECFRLSDSLFGSRPEVGIVVLYKFPPG